LGLSHASEGDEIINSVRTIYIEFCWLALEAAAQDANMTATKARISDKELAAINAAAVTREYRVTPHLGKNNLVRLFQLLNRPLPSRLSNGVRHQRASYAILQPFCWLTWLLNRPLVVLDDVKVGRINQSGLFPLTSAPSFRRTMRSFN